MVGTSNDGIMTEYLVKYGALKMSERHRPAEFLEILYVTERYRAGDDIKSIRQQYDRSVWMGISAVEIVRRLAGLDDFMRKLAQDRAVTWGLLN